jgi:hypothetical protein
MRSGIESPGCILVDEAKAASLDEDPSHEVTSAQVPTEGEWFRLKRVRVLFLSAIMIHQKLSSARGRGNSFRGRFSLGAFFSFPIPLNCFLCTRRKGVFGCNIHGLVSRAYIKRAGIFERAAFLGGLITSGETFWPTSSEKLWQFLGGVNNSTKGARSSWRGSKF